MKSHSNQGFTLIELLVVIAIIGLLSSVVLASLNTARAKARDAKRQSDMHAMQVALELYYSTNGTYPVTGNWQSECVGWGGPAAPNTVIPYVVPNYIPSMVADPGMVKSANQNCYLYHSNGTSYKILDYNIIDSANPGGGGALVDPARNYGQSYPRPAGCSTTEGTKTWAIWSDPASMCW